MAKFKSGDTVKHKTNGLTGIVEGWASEPGNVNVRSGGRVYMWDEDDLVLVKNSRACNTLRPYGSWKAASRGNVHVGDYVIHKAQYASFKDDEEKLDRNSERVAGVQSDGFWTDMSGTNELERYSDYYVFNAVRAANAKFNDGDTIEWYGKQYKVIGILGSEMRINEVDSSGKLKQDGDYVISQGDSHVKRIANAARACNSTNPIVRKAMNARIGRDLQDAGAVSTWVDMFRNFLDWHLPKSNDKQKARKNGETIIKYVEEASHSEGGKEQLRKMGWTVQKMRDTLEKAIAAKNAQYEYHTYLVPVIRKGKKDYVTIFRVADEETAKKLVDVPSYRNIGVTVDESRPVKIANAEDAQGHEHGSDGKFTSKDGGSDGGDSYEDPKTKRMKERLAKMREKNEALRKEIDQRKAALAGRKAETEKMRADIMKANVEKWKAGLPKSKNAVVAKALNAGRADGILNPRDKRRVDELLELRDKRRADANKKWHELYLKYKGHIPVDEVKKFDESPIGKGREFSQAEKKEFDRLMAAVNAVAYTNPETSDKVVIKPFAGLWDVRVVPPYFHNLFTAKTKDEAVEWAKANGKTITKIEDAVAKNDWVADRTGDYTWRETAKERGIKSALRAAGATYADYIPIDHFGSGARLDALSWVVRADESIIDKIAEKMKQLGMKDVSNPKWYQYDEFSVVGYTKINPRPTNSVAKNADVASQKLRNEWHNVFRSLKKLYDVAKSENHKSIMDAANAATRTLMDKTQGLGLS